MLDTSAPPSLVALIGRVTVWASSAVNVPEGAKSAPSLVS